MNNTPKQTDADRAFIAKARTIQVHRPGAVRGEDIWDLSTLRTHHCRSDGNPSKKGDGV